MLKKHISTIIALWLLFIIIGCAASVSNKPMTEGERLYRARCRSCHNLIDPKKYSDGQWEIFVKKYGEISNLTENESKLILEYLTENN
jgi:hypothetical protein